VRVLRTVLGAPFTTRARREFLFCFLAALTAVVEVFVVMAVLQPGTAASASFGGLFLALAVVLVVATGGAGKLGAAFRRLAAMLLGERVPAPPPWRTDLGLVGRLRARLRDGPSWRAMAYMVVRLPVAALDLYALAYWAGLVNLTYPFWWRLFRNHPPNVHLRPVPFITPFGAFHVVTFSGTFLVFAVGAAMVLAAPWVARGVTSVDRWLIRGLLGPARLAERVQALQETRAQAIDDSAATLRRIERDLHDGTQASLATLAMNLGQAKEKLEHGSAVPFDPAGALELVDAAHRHAKEALVELRDIARGIHPPALDIGLDAALATLVARSSVPTTLDIDVPTRPTEAIETIAYFSVAELLANVARHSRARHAAVAVTTHNDRLRIEVTDDGTGGAVAGAGSGLTGLGDRVRAVDGRLRLSSPEGGPTVVTVSLPLHA
jgi:signal transduction histidine kinase